MNEKYANKKTLFAKFKDSFYSLIISVDHLK
ncbi:hypothetical protein MHSWG343_08650 [Candidatus Mycoplasma haematohominis]|uniref:Uncharacterized protein n=1 Tax=Candidatus Mycoplasma haematohominis TaxID=1494318 RepID=A0A478FQL9_9MOLU|nr:hypothetical protein MHSWG343_08650 [Candidatus Mycoplasma haemohominis]